MGAKQKKSPKRERTRATPPASGAFNYWVNFVLYAVTGHLAQADALVAQHGGDVLRVSRWMMGQRPVAIGVLYRGVLIEPGKLDRGWLEHEEERRFLSYSEDKSVACWFADPASIISETVVEKYPASQGYLIKGRVPTSKVLWHHDWMQVEVPGAGVLPLAMAAALHPDIDEGQFIWNAATQREVITQPPGRKGAKLRVFSIESEGCPDSDELDARFAYPPYVASRWGDG